MFACTYICSVMPREESLRRIDACVCSSYALMFMLVPSKNITRNIFIGYLCLTLSYVCTEGRRVRWQDCVWPCKDCGRLRDIRCYEAFARDQAQRDTGVTRAWRARDTSANRDRSCCRLRFGEEGCKPLNKGTNRPVIVGNHFCLFYWVS